MSNLIVEILENVFTNLLDRFMFGSLFSSLMFSAIYPILKRFTLVVLQNIDKPSFTIDENYESRHAKMSAIVGITGAVIIGLFLGFIAAPIYGGLFASVWLIIYIQIAFTIFVSIAPIYVESIKFSQFLRVFSIILAISMFITGALGLYLKANNIVQSDSTETVFAFQFGFGQILLLASIMNFKAPKKVMRK